MTKRFIALFTALLLVFSAFLMTACDKDSNTDNSGAEEQSKVDIATLSAKELFEYSLTNTAKTDSIPEIMTKESDLKASYSIELNELSAAGEDITQGKPIKLTFDGAFDVDNTAAELNAQISAFGETPSLSAIVSKDGAWVTDLLGVNNKAIGVKFDELEIPDASGEITAATNAFNDALLAITGANEEIVNAYNEAVSKYVTDDQFAKENGAVTIDGVTVENATTVTFTFTSEDAKNVFKDVLTKIISLEAFKEYVGDEEVDVDEALAAFDSLGDLKYANVIDAEGNLVAMDIYFTVNSENYETGEIEAQAYAIKATMVNDSCKVHIGMLKDGALDAEAGIVKCEYTYNKETNEEKFFFGIQEGEETETYITIDGTFKDGKHEGVFSVPEMLSIKYSFEGDGFSGKLSISEISVIDQGVTTTIPLEFNVEFACSDRRIGYEYILKLDVQDVAKIDLSIKAAIEVANVTVEAPTDYTNATELTEEDMAPWLQQLPEKYPTFYALIEAAMNSYEGDAQPDDFYNDAYYEDGYYEDGYYDGDVFGNYE